MLYARPNLIPLEMKHLFNPNSHKYQCYHSSHFVEDKIIKLSQREIKLPELSSLMWFIE